MTIKQALNLSDKDGRMRDAFGRPVIMDYTGLALRVMAKAYREQKAINEKLEQLLTNSISNTERAIKIIDKRTKSLNDRLELNENKSKGYKSDNYYLLHNLNKHE